MEKAKQVRDQLMKEINKTSEAVAKSIGPVGEGEMDNALAILQTNAELAKMYQESSKVGAQNLGGSIPMLKIHTTNKSVGNELADGSEPNDGWFFYNQTSQQFKNPICHILTISKGFRAEGMVDSKTGIKGDDKFNQIMGGVIEDEGSYLPFIFYFTGMRLSRLWEFGKEAGKYTHAKPFPIPMFALSVKLSTVKEKNPYGMTSVVVFEILKDKAGNPLIVTDPGKFIFLRDNVEQLEDTISSLIAAKSTEEKVQSIKPAKVIEHDDTDAFVVPDMADDSNPFAEDETTVTR